MAHKQDYGPISQYNSLTDPNLQGYFSKTPVRNHLRHTGLINRKGEIIPEEVWRKRIINREKISQASQLVANKIVQQAVEIKNLERAELRRKLEEVAKRELVRRIRGESVQNRQLPLLWSSANRIIERPLSESTKHRNHHESRSLSPRNQDDYGEIRVIDDMDDAHYHRRVKMLKQRQRGKSARLRRRKSYTRCASAALRKDPNPIKVTMVYYGKGIKLPFDTQVFEAKDQIDVYQQHCGGENLVVHSGLYEAGDRFTFISKRHKEYPFSLTLYINGTYDCRISTCCEYKHALNARIGGKTGRFGFTEIAGDHPCIKCLLERENKKNQAPKPKPPPMTNDNSDINVITADNKGAKNDDSSRDKTQIKLREGYASDFDDEEGGKVENTPRVEDYSSSDESARNNYKWSALVYTSAKKTLPNRKSEASVYLKIVGDKGYSDTIFLESMQQPNKFVKSDKFEVATKNIGSPTQLIVTQEDKNSSFDWTLDKIVLTDLQNSKTYTFPYGNKVVRNKPTEIALSRGSPAKDESKDSKNKIDVKTFDESDTAEATTDFDEDDERDDDGTNINWKVRVFTSNKNQAGTDARVYATLIGSLKESDRFGLDEKTKTDKNKELFEKNCQNEFSIKTDRIGKLRRIRLGHDNSGFGPAWHLNKVEVVNVKNNLVYTFECNRWFSKDDDDKKIERILSKTFAKKASISEPTKSTGSPETKKPPRKLSSSSSSSSDSETAKETPRDIQKKSVSSISSANNSARKEATNQAARKLSTDSSLSTPKEAKSPLVRKDSEEKKKKPSTSSSTDSDLTHDFFEKKVDQKKAEVEKKATAAKLSSRSTSSSDSLELPDSSRKKPESPAKPATASTHSVDKSAAASRDDENTQWRVKVHTSDLKSDSFEGTDAKVYMSLIGSLGESEKIFLNKTNSKGGPNKDIFEKGQVDEFAVNNVKKIGKLAKIRIGHDGSGFGSAWHLNKVEVIDQTSGATSVFVCNRWLAKDEDDGLTERVLDKPTVIYTPQSQASDTTTDSDASTGQEQPNRLTGGQVQKLINKELTGSRSSINKAEPPAAQKDSARKASTSSSSSSDSSKIQSKPNKSPLARADSNSSKQSDKPPVSSLLKSKKNDASSLFSDDSDDTITSPRVNKKGETPSNDEPKEPASRKSSESSDKNVPAMYKTIREVVNDPKQEANKSKVPDSSSSTTSLSSQGSARKAKKDDEKPASQPGSKMVVPTVNVIASSEVDENSVSRKNSNSDTSEVGSKKGTKISDSQDNMKDWYNNDEALANAGLI